MFTKVKIMDKPESKYILDESKGRRAYVLNLFGIFIILPALASYLAHLIGFDISTFTAIAKVDANGNQIAQGFKMNFLSVWYLSLPLFVFFTYRRVTDTKLNPWFTVLFVLPFINLIIWFWPSNKR
jgi:ABC-type uncharacterized transport system permease subunit